jgi:urease accessory protein
LASPILALLPSAAFAHPGHDLTATFVQGVIHPLSGIDHMLAMVMVGLFAVQLGGRALWLLPSAFLAAMVVGSLAGLSGITPSMKEVGIALSVVLLGAMIALQPPTPVTVAMALVAAVALVHGHAHGAEAQGAVSFAYVIGFLVGTAGLLLGGMLAGLCIVRVSRGTLIARAAGVTAAGTGVLLLTTT